MVYWRPFEYEGKVYDLSHLHPLEELIYIQPQKGDKPERIYIYDTIFSLHCFTRSQKNDETTDNNLLYSDRRETRIFDFHRYELSKKLPDIIRELGQRKCFHTGTKRNFFTVDIQSQNGNVVKYEIYFKVSRSKKHKDRLTVFIESAYTRDESRRSNQPKKKPIAFSVIAHNTLTGKPSKIPK